METIYLDLFGDVIVTEGMANNATGKRIYGVFYNEKDAKSEIADVLVVAILGEDDLTEEQKVIARKNSERL